MGTLYFITGGVRSGKSSFAEKWAIEMKKSNVPLVYLACGVNTDREMEQRILKHQQDRQASAGEWRTIECPDSIEWIVNHIPQHSVVLLDCLTTLLTNEMYGNGDGKSQNIEEKIYQSIIQLLNRVNVLILVSNELVSDLPIDSNDLLTFQKRLGALHIRMVKKACVAIEMTAGIPIVKKRGHNEEGRLPHDPI
ncbi:bifunctional adenosylcobinamide kinase/adenosylcobinamide-phosphate guanylyltransferase [uncultured Rossellomorea sp.]|uniref:bifunctional adenosylcobinamide kinase/adenosylcobinamide-phosphate guanylyltransferase n=1 Tax=uncultured Rossellomorea sp. TaxID=2837549 RepID=UPI002631934F|nr:bifunctional adenosylcobinamide kinase/adenosylcobinamide-phosphate guanylyltransferase [uncultured Rossellomorea sp.]